MNALTPTPEQFKNFIKYPDNEAFVMINLLRFKCLPSASGSSGQEAYERYMANVAPILKKIGGQLIWMGRVDQVFIGTPEVKWDKVMLVRYPSRKAFMEMISMPDYLTAHSDREAGIENSVLLATTEEIS